MLVSDIQQSDSVIGIHVTILFQVLFPFSRPYFHFFPQPVWKTFRSNPFSDKVFISFKTQFNNYNHICVLTWCLSLTWDCSPIKGSDHIWFTSFIEVMPSFCWVHRRCSVCWIRISIQTLTPQRQGQMEVLCCFRKKKIAFYYLYNILSFKALTLIIVIIA